MSMLSISSHSSLSSHNLRSKNKNIKCNPRSTVSCSFVKNTVGQNTDYLRKRLSFCKNHLFGSRRHLSFCLVGKEKLLKPVQSSGKDEGETEQTSSSSSVAVVTDMAESETKKSEGSSQEVELSKESDQLEKEKEKQQELDWKTDEEFKKFMGNPSIEAAIKLEKKRAARKLKEIDTESSTTFKALDLNKACVVQPKSEMDLQFESTKLSTRLGYVSAIVLCVATFGTIALMSGFFLKPDATFDDYIADVIPLFSGFLTILGVSEIATRVTASRYGVKLSPSFLVPSNWTGCVGVMNNYESLLPNKNAFLIFQWQGQLVHI